MEHNQQKAEIDVAREAGFTSDFEFINGQLTGPKLSPTNHFENMKTIFPRPCKVSQDIVYYIEFVNGTKGTAVIKHCEHPDDF